MEGSDKKKVLIIASNALLANLWRSAFEGDAEFEIFAVESSFADGSNALRQADLVLVNVLERVEQGLQWVVKIKLQAPRSRVVVLGIPRREHILLAYIEAGAVGFVPEDSSLEEAREAMQAAAAGAAILDPQVTPALINRLHSLQNGYHEPDTAGRRIKQLTPREQEVLELVSEKMTNREIAKELVIELGTVKNHVHSILEKLEFNSRYEAAAYYHSALRSIDNPTKRQAS